MSEIQTATAAGTIRRRTVSAENEPATPRLSLEDMPPPDTTRWVARRKALVVHGVRAGLLSLAEACRRYQLSVEEFEIWERLIDRHGTRGLRVTRIKEYRSKPAVRRR